MTDETIHRCLNAHTRPYFPKRCASCGKPAKVEVWTGTNDYVAAFCLFHGNQRVAEFHESGKRQAARREATP